MGLFLPCLHSAVGSAKQRRIDHAQRRYHLFRRKLARVKANKAYRAAHLDAFLLAAQHLWTMMVYITLNLAVTTALGITASLICFAGIPASISLLQTLLATNTLPSALILFLTMVFDVTLVYSLIDSE